VAEQFALRKDGGIAAQLTAERARRGRKSHAQSGPRLFADAALAAQEQGAVDVGDAAERWVDLAHRDRLAENRRRRQPPCPDAAAGDRCARNSSI
jgi:hypothetical protein